MGFIISTIYYVVRIVNFWAEFWFVGIFLEKSGDSVPTYLRSAVHLIYVYMLSIYVGNVYIYIRYVNHVHIYRMYMYKVCKSLYIRFYLYVQVYTDIYYTCIKEHREMYIESV